MRVQISRPARKGPWPGVILFSEIFQITGPIQRLAAQIASQGLLVAVPEVYHEFLTPGAVLAYDGAGADRGNELKYAKELASYDDDASVVVEHLLQREDCLGRIGAFGVCLGGHLALRAAFHPKVAAVVCCYPTDVHSGTLGAGKRDDTLTRARGDPCGAFVRLGTPGPPMYSGRDEGSSTNVSRTRVARLNGTSSTRRTPSCVTRDRATMPPWQRRCWAWPRIYSTGRWQPRLRTRSRPIADACQAVLFCYENHPVSKRRMAGG